MSRRAADPRSVPRRRDSEDEQANRERGWPTRHPRRVDCRSRTAIERPAVPVADRGVPLPRLPRRDRSRSRLGRVPRDRVASRDLGRHDRRCSTAARGGRAARRRPAATPVQAVPSVAVDAGVTSVEVLRAERPARWLAGDAWSGPSTRSSTKPEVASDAERQHGPAEAGGGGRDRTSRTSMLEQRQGSRRWSRPTCGCRSTRASTHWSSPRSRRSGSRRRAPTTALVSIRKAMTTLSGVGLQPGHAGPHPGQLRGDRHCWSAGISGRHRRFRVRRRPTSHRASCSG